MVFGAYVFAIRKNILPEGGSESVEHTGWRVWGKEKNHTAFFRYRRNELKLTFENRTFIPDSNTLYRALNMYGHILQSKTLLQSHVIPKNAFYIYLSLIFYGLLLWATQDQIEIKYVCPVISSRTIKHSSFTNILTPILQENWHLLIFDILMLCAVSSSRKGSWESGLSNLKTNKKIK